MPRDTGREAGEQHRPVEPRERPQESVERPQTGNDIVVRIAGPHPPECDGYRRREEHHEAGTDPGAVPVQSRPLDVVEGAVRVAPAVGGALGVYTTVRNSPVPDRLVAAGSYGTLGVPNFYLAAVVLPAGTAWGFDLRGSPTEPAAATPLATLALAALVVTTTLLDAQLRYVRSETASRASMAFVRTVRAKGGGRVRAARHLLRVAALPLLSLFAAELLGVLFVGTFVVEAILGMPGLGTRLLDALDTRDVPVVVGAALAFVLVAVVVTVVQDLLCESLDPRTDPDGE